jgi:diguanylate cyclase (GGDEF)-like protein
VTRFFATCLFGCLLAVVSTLPALASHVSVASTRPGSTPGTVIYRLHIGTGVGTTVVLLPADARASTLEVNGVVRERVGLRNPLGSSALGHAGPTFTLTGEGPRDRVEVRVEGSSANLRFIDGDLAEWTHDIGLASGAYYAVFITLAIFQLAALYTLRDSSIAWYLGFTLSLAGLELSRDDLLPFGTSAALHEFFRSAYLACIVGFCAAFLRLRTRAPRLFVAALALGVGPVVLTSILALLRHSSLAIPTLAATGLVTMVALMAIAAIRRHEGYLPATYLFVGLVGIPIAFVIQIAFTLTGHNWPALNYWGLEVGSTFDVFAFSLAILVRTGYVARQSARVRSDLHVANYAATHDELTGLSNRRGLDASLERISSCASTVLFVDLDRFKTINDAGGHAAGDAALKDVADILRRAVRRKDVVARVGGDEFVVVLVGTVDHERVAEVIAEITDGISSMQPLGPGAPERLGVSIGSAEVAVGSTFSNAVAHADTDAYRMKAEQRTLARAATARNAPPVETKK